MEHLPCHCCRVKKQTEHPRRRKSQPRWLDKRVCARIKVPMNCRISPIGDHRYPRLMITSGGEYRRAARSLINDYVSDVEGYSGWSPRERPRTRVFACCIDARFATAIPLSRPRSIWSESRCTRRVFLRHHIGRSAGLSTDPISNACGRREREPRVSRSVHRSRACTYTAGQ